jgi:hypothetical protein
MAFPTVSLCDAAAGILYMHALCHILAEVNSFATKNVFKYATENNFSSNISFMPRELLKIANVYIL